MKNSIEYTYKDLFFIICILFQFLLIAISIFLFFYLKKRKDIFPYANISPIWTMTFLICICIREIIQVNVLIFPIFPNFPKLEFYYNYLDLLSVLFIHYVLIWPILGRIYYISQCMEFNYSFLTKKIYPNYLRYENDLDLTKNMYSEKRTVYVSKIIFFPLFSIFLILVILSLIPYTRCYLYAFISLNDALLNECSNVVTNLNYIILRIIKLLVDIAEIFLLTIFLFYVLLYPLREDKFKIRQELCILYSIWFLAHHVHHTLIIFEIFEYSLKRNLIFNIVEDSSYVLLCIILIIVRNKIDVNQFYSMLYNFELFMRNPICFNYFKDYIKSTHEEEYSALFFYLEMHFYKKKFNLESYDNNVILANSIYLEYFSNTDKNLIFSSSIKHDNRFSYTRTRSYSALSQPKSIGARTSFIDFPCEVVEKIEDFKKSDLKISNRELFSLFDEAIEHVNNKLYNRYLIMTRDEDEIKKLEKLICYFDFDFNQNPESVCQDEENIM